MTAFLVMTIAVGASAATMLGGLGGAAASRTPASGAGLQRRRRDRGRLLRSSAGSLEPGHASAAHHRHRSGSGIFSLSAVRPAGQSARRAASASGSPWRGRIGAGSFSAHSLLDGFAIGIAFQAGQAVGFVVAAAVLVHDFSDGLNTVNVVVKNGGRRASALTWLVVDAAGAAGGRGFKSSGRAAARHTGAAAGGFLRFLSLYRRQRSSAGESARVPPSLDNNCDTSGCGSAVSGDTIGAVEIFNRNFWFKFPRGCANLFAVGEKGLWRMPPHFSRCAFCPVWRRASFSAPAPPSAPAFPCAPPPSSC